MALVSMRQLLDHAAEFSYGLPAFNVNNLEQMRAIMEAADKCDAPVIVQASAGARKYAGAPFLRHMILAAVEEFPHIPVVMHQDHGTSPDVCQRSIQLGFSSVMMDGSLKSDGKTPADYDYNVDVTRTVVNFAHACGTTATSTANHTSMAASQGRPHSARNFWARNIAIPLHKHFNIPII